MSSNESETVTESEGAIRVEDTSEKENIEPPEKKPRLESKKHVKLEARLNDILSCTVCLDLPKKAVFQCQNGHLMCAGCFTHLLADARLKDEQARCPNCRTEISRNVCQRNLAVEKTVSELPSYCKYCGQELARVVLDRHEKQDCEERLSACKYESLGCKWEGPYHDKGDHEMGCSFPKKTGNELLETLNIMAQKHSDDRKLFETVVGLLSFEKIAINDLQLRPYRTDDYIPQLYYETSRFNALGHQWVVKAKINGSEKSCRRVLSYQLLQKSKGNCNIKFMMLRSPFGESAIKPALKQYEFNEDNIDSGHHDISLADPSECNKMLAARFINLRLLMFQIAN